MKVADKGKVLKNAGGDKGQDQSESANPKTTNQGKVTDPAEDTSSRRRATGTRVNAVQHYDDIPTVRAEDNTALGRDGIVPTTQREVMLDEDETNGRGPTETLKSDRKGGGGVDPRIPDRVEGDRTVIIPSAGGNQHGHPEKQTDERAVLSTPLGRKDSLLTKVPPTGENHLDR